MQPAKKARVAAHATSEGRQRKKRVTKVCLANPGHGVEAGRSLAGVRCKVFIIRKGIDDWVKVTKSNPIVKVTANPISKGFATSADPIVDAKAGKKRVTSLLGLGRRLGIEYGDGMEYQLAVREDLD